MVALSKNSKSRLSKTYKKYVDGGGVDENGNQRITGNQAASGGLGIATSAIGTASTGNTNVGMGIATGAASGAAAGSVAGPWGMAAGAVVGGTIGGISAKVNSDKAKRAAQEYQDAVNKQNYNLAIQRGKQTAVNGNQVYSLTERKQGGKLSALSSNTMLATGATHEEGGIKLPQLGAEVEDKETLKMTKDGGTYVMSDTLVNPTSGNTFAKDDLRLSKMKGRLEKINHSFGKNALTLLKNKEQKLVDLHEQVRQEQGLETADGTQVAKHGGLLKYSRGGGIDDTFDKSGNWASDNEDGFQNNFVFKGRSRGRVGDNNTYTYDKLNDSFTMNGKSIPNTQNNYLKSTFNITNSKPYIPSNPTLADQAIFDAEKPQLLEEPITKLYGSRRPISVSSTEPVVDSNTTGKTKSKFNVSNLSKLSAYTDNITAAIYNNQRSKEKLPNLSTLTYLNPKHVNYSQALKDTRDTTTAFNRGVDTTNVNQGNANIMKAFALGKQQQAIAGISQEESNQNTVIDNDFAGRTKAIEEKNNMTIFNNAERSRLGRDEIRRESQQNIVDANMKLQTQLKSKNQQSDDKDAELAHQQKSIDFIESEKAKREANESGIWKNGRFMRSSNRNGGKLSKLKISY